MNFSYSTMIAGESRKGDSSGTENERRGGNAFRYFPLDASSIIKGERSGLNTYRIVNNNKVNLCTI